VERLLIGDRPIQDRLDGFGGGRQPLEHEKYRVADAALDPDLIVGCHARPSLLVLHHVQVWEARHIRERWRFPLHDRGFDGWSLHPYRMNLGAVRCRRSAAGRLRFRGAEARGHSAPLVADR
jgi:hypothetical protein